jgi:hypothetical protein
MIQFDKDGVTLFYIDANGQRVAHNFMDGQAYDDMLTVRGAQQQAARDNTLAVANYNTALSNAQISVSAGRTATAPPKPLQEVVADADGAVTYIPFVPPLADLVMPTVDPSTVTGLVNTALPAPVDKQAVMYNMILAMFRKAFPDA